MITDQQKEADVRRRAWTLYWQEGSLHSLCGSYAGNYDGEIADFWKNAFDTVPGSGHVVDIGTGNGSIPHMLYVMREDSIPWIDAFDLAQPSPAWLHAVPADVSRRIRFHGGLCAEQLPFNSGKYDLATSQYGLEYTRLDESLGEIARILRPGGGLAAVMHHARSRIADIAREELRLTDILLADDGLLATARDLYPWMALAARHGPGALAGREDADTARRNYNSAIAALSAEIGQSPAPDLAIELREAVNTHLHAVSTRAAEPDMAIHSNQALREQLRLSAFRNAEVCRFALDDAGMAALVECMAAHGLGQATTSLLMHASGHLLGWGLRATRL